MCSSRNPVELPLHRKRARWKSKVEDTCCLKKKKILPLQQLWRWESDSVRGGWSRRRWPWGIPSWSWTSRWRYSVGCSCKRKIIEMAAGKYWRNQRLSCGHARNELTITRIRHSYRELNERHHWILKIAQVSLQRKKSCYWQCTKVSSSQWRCDIIWGVIESTIEHISTR